MEVINPEFTTVNVIPIPLNVHLNGVGFLEPKDDITPKESVLLCMMIVSGMVAAFVDYPSFIKQHGLERHFKP